MLKVPWLNLFAKFSITEHTTVILQVNYSVEIHVNYVLSLCCQKIYLLKRLHDQGLDRRHLDLLFQAIVVCRILYGILAWGSFLSKEQWV